MSSIKRYDMYKAGEYIKESCQEEIEYWKAFHKLQAPEEQKLQLLRLEDKWGIRQEKIQGLLMIGMLLVGVLMGTIIGYSAGIDMKETLLAVVP